MNILQDLPGPEELAFRHSIMSTSRSTSARIRKATAADLEELSLVLARGFARDPFCNWIAGAIEIISSANTKDTGETKAIEQLRYLQWTLARLFLFCGEIDVVVIHVDGHEKIVATTSWIEPGKPMEPTFLQLPRMRLFRIWKAWGSGPFKVRLIDSKALLRLLTYRLSAWSSTTCRGQRRSLKWHSKRAERARKTHGIWSTSAPIRTMREGVGVHHQSVHASLTSLRLHVYDAQGSILDR